MKKLLAILLLAPGLLWAAETGYRLDRSPHDPTDLVSLQVGAKLYMNYCLGCHGLKYMRYNRLTELGLTEEQIRDNLLFTAEKVGEPIAIAMPQQAAKQWFGVPPPDLTVIARARGADWLYTYLRTFYRDTKTTTGWNNVVFDNVAMPHVLWKLQGERGYDPVKGVFTELSPGELSPVQYDMAMRDLVNFLVYAGEPAAWKREFIGIIVLFVLGVVFIFAWLLKREFWKDVK